jgi:hypothetical protein
MQTKREFFREEKMSWAKQRVVGHLSMKPQDDIKTDELPRMPKEATVVIERTPKIPSALLHRLERHLQDYRLSDSCVL